MYKHNYPLKKNYLTFREQKALSTLEHSEIIRTSEAHTYLKQANETLSQLVKKGHFIRLKKGLLISKEAFLQRPYEVVSKAMKGVVSYISALHLHGILEYEPNVIYIQVESRPFETSIGKYTIKATTTTHKFGLVQQEGIFVTDTEKTLLDCLSHPTRAGGYTVIARALKESKLNWKRLLEYLELFDKGSLYQKLGYLLTKTGKKTPRYVLRELKTHVKNNCRLVSDTSTSYTYNTEWKIMDNTGVKEWN
ncbi:MAG: type IV toxin-antitoxin system AbiEi family antitoxin domain-containing protein [Nanoarchaeota archaeon]